MNRTVFFKSEFWRWTALLYILMILPARSIAQVYTTNVFTVTINDVSLIRINPYAVINMSLLAATAGESMAPKTNSTSYMQITSIAPVNQTRRVMAVISGGTVPSGTLLTLTVGSSSGVGNFGVPASTITLQRVTNQTIINSIASGYTGGSAGNGFNLTYTWQVDQNTFQLLRAVLSVPIIITYTITSN
jgi:general stress protein CsbA